ncbi:MAG: flavin reductase family protein [Bacteroidetes bacterium]|nr:flavin reductase family protein [Bacteroidota bacterium]
MLSIDPQSIPIPQLHQYLVGAVAPRPIAFVSTVSESGTPNLAPYSFFNVFSSNPATLVFSSNRTVQGNKTKDTLTNVETTREAVVNIVNYDITHQMTIASVSYPEDVNEFEKAGLTAIASDLVKPFRVKESPFQMECKVKDIISLGDQGGAGNLVICEIVKIHISEDILDEKGRIDPYKAHLMGRMGRAFYCHAIPESIFPIVREVSEIVIGIDGLPARIRKSEILTGRQLAELACVTAIPVRDEKIIASLGISPTTEGAAREKTLHRIAQMYIDSGEVDKAWQVLLV